jgi:predicted nuclease of predicted toxin-antitoxin system
MRFLLNMNVSRTIGQTLEELGNEWVHVRDIGMTTAGDQAIVTAARNGGQIIVTHDLETRGRHAVAMHLRSERAGAGRAAFLQIVSRRPVSQAT